jgi:hypothetical protein
VQETYNRPAVLGIARRRHRRHLRKQYANNIDSDATILAVEWGEFYN